MNVTETLTWHYMVVLFAFIVLGFIIVLCAGYVYVICRGLILSRQNAYGKLVRSDFFTKWLIRDLDGGLTYNPSGVRQTPIEREDDARNSYANTT